MIGWAVFWIFMGMGVAGVLSAVGSWWLSRKRKTTVPTASSYYDHCQDCQIGNAGGW